MQQLKKALNGFLAGITSPEAVKQEKSLALLVVTRVILAVGAGDAFIKAAQALLS
jgi:hypothetical protein